jgi:hypothetical protein
VNRHHIIPPTHKGEPVFTPDAWRLFESKIETLPGNGGCIAIVFDVEPRCRNFVECSVSVFTAKERTVIRNAITRARKKATQAAANHRRSMNPQTP